jgi:predicted enzyme involved in methoxymalonyl-ACP biosynthesis
MLQHALAIAKKHGYATLVGEFVPTKRNQVADRFFVNHGFMSVNSTDPFSSTQPKLFEELRKKSTVMSSRFYFRITEPTNLPFLNIYEGN